MGGSPNGRATEFSLLYSNSQPQYIPAGPDGNLWFTEYDDSTSLFRPSVSVVSSTIGRITPSGAITEYPLAEASSPAYIPAGPDGNLWFTEQGSAKIGRITPGGIITEFALPDSDGTPYGITTGPDQNIWLTETQGVIGRGDSGK